MNSKYYISNNLFFTNIDIEKAWNYLIEFFIHLDFDEIVIVNYVGDKKCKISEKTILHTDFKDEKPIKIFITNSPFVLKEDKIYTCYYYKKTDNIIKIISTEWLEALKFEYVTSLFKIMKNDQMLFMISYYDIVALLTLSELNYFNNILGCEFKEWNIKLNDTL